MRTRNEIEKAVNYLKGSKTVTKTFHKVRVDYVEGTGTLYIDDYDTDEQLAIFYVMEEG